MRFARPMLEALDSAEARGEPYDLSSLQVIASSGVMWSQEVKQGLLRHHDMILLDLMGSSEGTMGSSLSARDLDTGTAKFTLGDGTKVFTDDDREVVPGSGEMGKVATSGMVPLGYYKDEGKSADTFREIDGVRYSFPGDFATVAADGTVTLLGRGSLCINTAGEKVFPEEVEEVVKKYPSVCDCLVVGVPDARFGERIVAVVGLQVGQVADEAAIIDFTKQQLSGYKAPKQILFVEQVQRAPNGKPDQKMGKSPRAGQWGAVIRVVAVIVSGMLLRNGR